MLEWIKKQIEYEKFLWILNIVCLILIVLFFTPIFKGLVNSDPLNIGVLYLAGLAYNIYRTQAEISDTTNLMTTWCEHNRIMESINDPKNKEIKPLKYFELFMFFERICGLYYTEWKYNPRIRKEFHVLYDATIDANCRKHFEE